MTHRLNLLLLVLALAFGLPWYWLLLENPSSNVAPHPIRMAELRRLAGSLPGAPPQAIAATVVAWDRTPGTLLAAGAGIKRHLYTVISYSFDVPGSGPIVIDTGTTGQLAMRERTEAFVEPRQRKVAAALRRASLILATDESPDSLGGLAHYARGPQAAPALARARLNAAQLPSVTRAAGLPWPAQTNLEPAIVPGAPQAVAPGVVVIPTRAPTPGAQLVYVRLANGREYLFAGALAPYAVNAAELRTRSRLLDWMDGPQDRAGAMRWLVTLRQWRREAPDLFVVPGHDILAITDRERPSGIAIGE